MDACTEETSDFALRMVEPSAMLPVMKTRMQHQSSCALAPHLLCALFSLMIGATGCSCGSDPKPANPCDDGNE